MVNLRELTDAELAHMVDTTEAYLTKLKSETDRRKTIDTAQELVNDLNLRYFQALGRLNGVDWIGPSTASESYPRGWTVTHEGGVWKSTMPGNIEEPGQGEAWERLGDDPRYVQTPGETVLIGADVLVSGGDEEDDLDVEIDVDDIGDAEPGEDDA